MLSPFFNCSIEARLCSDKQSILLSFVVSGSGVVAFVSKSSLVLISAIERFVEEAIQERTSSADIGQLFSLI